MSEGEEKRGILSARQRRERAAAELRANLAKRKAQARAKARLEDEADALGNEPVRD